MKSYRKALVMSLALLSPVAVIAEPAQTGTESGMVGQGPGVPRGEHGKRFIEERMAELHKELKLTAAQEADWNTWSAKIKEIREAKKQSRPDREAMKNLPAPERLEKMIAHNKAKQTYLEEALGATKTFYATLTPEQRKVFDDLTPFGERAPKWKHHGGPRHSGAK
ncbi:Spy/CpxP family protein refolding chaperone [Methylocaldum sp.]|uniref:Spy/CpxP family protein refolding chaperone n=1 Tax=Methylocaldum sp. TaxID=1969727 RepID=UPI002D623CF8|nr:Spy/CpxP family protein refolding chaperone [Methylocaldum sp.]HYE36901.1 Spy/CpxP family protein refolding chaperone [Methylocaldum sp.]